MHFDFAALLVLATAVTGLIWALDAWLWAPNRRRQVLITGDEPDDVADQVKEPVLVEYAKSLFPVILAVLVLRSFIVEPFRIPSGSMIPTLLVGDFILVNKFAYGLRVPVLNAKFIDTGSPERGDVVVFRYPREPSIDYIKRVIGLPGDKIAYYDKQLYVNGEAYEQTNLGEFQGDNPGGSYFGSELIQEQIGDRTHQIIVDPRPGRPEGEGEITVPEGYYFVMGDNRDNSNDSRFWGPVPEENLVGEAFLIWMNWDSNASGIRWDRIGNSID